MATKGKRHHSWQYRIINWKVCSGCGLILLNNKASHKAAAKLCPGEDEY
jgi:hypothetical protein